MNKQSGRVSWPVASEERKRYLCHHWYITDLVQVVARVNKFFKFLSSRDNALSLSQLSNGFGCACPLYYLCLNGTIWTVWKSLLQQTGRLHIFLIWLNQEPLRRNIIYVGIGDFPKKCFAVEFIFKAEI